MFNDYSLPIIGVISLIIIAFILWTDFTEGVE